MIRGVLFDLGSTLIHTAQDLNWAVIFNRMRADLLWQLRAGGYSLDEGAFHARFIEKMRDYEQQWQSDWVEYTTGYLLGATLEDLGAQPLAPEVLARALEVYYAHSETLWQLAEGLYEMLGELRGTGFRLGLISNAGDAENVRRLIWGAGLAGVFEPELISASVGLRKPNLAFFRMALEAWGLPAGEVVMVGDTLGADILGAQLAGLHNAWIRASAGQPANVAHRGNIVLEAEIEGLRELPGVLEQMMAE